MVSIFPFIFICSYETVWNPCSKSSYLLVLKHALWFLFSKVLLTQFPTISTSKNPSVHCFRTHYKYCYFFHYVFESSKIKCDILCLWILVTFKLTFLEVHVLWAAPREVMLLFHISYSFCYSSPNSKLPINYWIFLIQMVHVLISNKINSFLLFKYDHKREIRKKQNENNLIFHNLPLGAWMEW